MVYIKKNKKKKDEMGYIEDLYEELAKKGATKKDVNDVLFKLQDDGLIDILDYDSEGNPSKIITNQSLIKKEIIMNKITTIRKRRRL